MCRVIHDMENMALPTEGAPDWNKALMTYRERGYLSPDSKRWIRRVRTKHPVHFRIIDDVSSLGQRVLPLFEGKPPEKQILLGGALFMRGLQTLQGAVLMVERGMALEAGTLARGCFETLFYLGCSVRDPEFGQKITLDHLARTETLFNDLRRKAPPDQIQMMDDTLAQARRQARVNKGKMLIMEQVAQAAGLGDMYGPIYRGLSSEAAHPTVMSLFAVWLFDQNGNIRGWRGGPESAEEKLADLLLLIALVGICFLEQANTLLKNDEIAAQIEEASRQYKELQGNREP
jgi:hypothetical protein